MRLTATPPAAAAGQSETVITQLRRIDLFEDSTPSELGELARRFRRISARPGQALEVQDRPVRWWSIVVSGHAVVQRDGTPLGLMGQGDSWSEHSLLNHQRSPISVVALSPVVVLSLPDHDFADLVLAQPGLGSRVVARAATSADRLALPVYRALCHMEWADEKRLRRELAELGPL